MNSSLTSRDLIGLGFMTFALFLGAGNIIFPPQVGQLAGFNLWWAALGFLLTGVGLPLLTVVALAKVGGGMPALTSPIGKVAGLILGIAVYLTIGPLFATPRTATVSFEIGFVPFVGHSSLGLAIYSIIFFSIVMLISLYPGRLLDTVGKMITPVLILSLIALALAAIFWPAGLIEAPQGLYAEQSFSQGFTQGYQTMDALGALVFGVVIVNAIKTRQITDKTLITRYAIFAGIIAAICLALVYVSLIWLGASSGVLAPNATTGAPILNAFVNDAFGPLGNVLLALVITLACLTTAIGLVSACGWYFSNMLPFSYRTVTIVISLLCMLVANLGLEQLISIAEPVLLTIYPIAIVLVLLSLAMPCWNKASHIFVPTLAVATIFGLIDAARALGYASWIPEKINSLPGANLGLSWIVPVLVVLAVVIIWDRSQKSSVVNV